MVRCRRAALGLTAAVEEVPASWQGSKAASSVSKENTDRLKQAFDKATEYLPLLRGGSSRMDASVFSVQP